MSLGGARDLWATSLNWCACRPRVRYPTDLTNRQWSIIERLLPEVGPRAPGGRPPIHLKREIVNAIFYVTPHRVLVADAARRNSRRGAPSTGTSPPGGTTAPSMSSTTPCATRSAPKKEKKGGKPRTAEPSGGIVDSQSLRAAETVSAASRGFDAGKKVNGRKRHIVTDTVGLLLVVMVTAASVRSDGGADALRLAHGWFPSLRHVFADGGYAGMLVAKAKRYWKLTVEVVAKPAGQRGFAVLPRRWVVERTFAWLVRWRRLVRDYERYPETHEAFVKWAMIGLMLNRLARPPGPRPWASKR